MPSNPGQSENPTIEQPINNGNPSDLPPTSSGTEKGPIGSIPQSSIMSASELYALVNSQNQPVIVDTRRSSDFAPAYIYGSLNIPISQLDVRINEIPLGRTVVLINEDDISAENCWNYLTANGWTPSSVMVLYGGISSWKNAGYPTENAMLTTDPTVC